VRDYAGDGKIETSGAVVNVIVLDTGIYSFTPPTGEPTNTTIWRVFDIVVDANGRLALNTISDYRLARLGSAVDNQADLYPP
jgi:hypothetical protein